MTEKFLNKEIRWRLCEYCFSAAYNGQRPLRWADVSNRKLITTPDDVLTACAGCLKVLNSRGYHYIVGAVSDNPDMEASTGVRRLVPEYIEIFKENTISIET